MRGPLVATALGAALVVALTALDAYWGSDHIIAATVAVGPFLTALAAGPRLTAAVAALAILATAVSGVWNENLGSAAYFVCLLVVIAGAGFALVAARTRERLAADQTRFALLRGAAQLADSADDIPAVLEGVRRLLVPALGDACTIELGAFERPAEDPTSILVPLRSRGREIGMLRLTSEVRLYTADDRRFARLLGGRIGLALDNAGLFAELEQLETRLTTALDALAEAVTIQSREGRLIYANDAAAEALGFTSAEQLLATPPLEIVDAYESFNEDGSRLRLEQLPGRAVLEGRTPEPLVVRAVRRDTGEERWRVIKATAAPGGLAVNVIEDVTDVKRAEHAQRFLAQAGAVLASSLDYEQTLARITRLAVPRLADWCAVSLPGAHALESVAVAHVDPAKISFARDYQQRYPTPLSAPTGAAQVLRDGTSQVINDISEELLARLVTDPEQLEQIRTIGMRAGMLVPMTSRRTHDRRHHVRQRRVRSRLHPAGPAARGRAGPACG